MKEVLHSLHLIGLAMAVGTGFCMMVLSKSAAALSPEERGKFMGRILVLSRVGSTGLLILILSGLALLWPLRGALMQLPLFHAKLGLVTLQAALVGYMQMLIAQVKRDPASPAAAKLPKVGPLLMINGLAILVIATYIFH